jgi:hypothetical protein
MGRFNDRSCSQEKRWTRRKHPFLFGKIDGQRFLKTIKRKHRDDCYSDQLNDLIILTREDVEYSFSRNLDWALQYKLGELSAYEKAASSVRSLKSSSP